MRIPARRYPTMGESRIHCVSKPSNQATVKPAARVEIRGRSCIGGEGVVEWCGEARFGPFAPTLTSYSYSYLIGASAF
jgi:hypothetical protein